MQIGFVLLKLKRNLVSMKESNWKIKYGEFGKPGNSVFDKCGLI